LAVVELTVMFPTGIPVVVAVTSRENEPVDQPETAGRVTAELPVVWPVL
jgi:hypothetical protein